MINLPPWIYPICADWHSGQASMMYMVCSSHPEWLSIGDCIVLAGEIRRAAFQAYKAKTVSDDLDDCLEWFDNIIEERSAELLD